MFLRFVAGTDADNPFLLDGVFTVAEGLRAEGLLYAFEERYLKEVFAWFQEHLPCPPFRARLASGQWSRDAVSWFRDDAGEPLSRIWTLVALIEEHGTPVRLVTRRWPGPIVYRDRYQVVAETPFWTLRGRSVRALR
jgi:hypothetical protein